MATRRYLNFDLLLEHDGDGQYEARVTAAPVAGLPHVPFRLPFDEKSLKILLMELDPGRTDVRGVDGAVQQQAAKDFGGPLFDAIFTGKLADAWTRSLGKAAAEKAGGLRLRLRVADDAADLAGLPWELLYDAKGRAFPAQSEITPLVRFLDVEDDVDAIQVTGPLRVLAIISSPAGLRRLEVEREWAHLETAMAAKVREGLVVVDRLPEPTLDALGDWLLDHDTHVIHFVGHGDFNPAGGGEGFIFFQDELGGADPVSAAVLGPFIHDHDALRMVVINACRTARVGRTDPYGGLAQGLVLQGATAVVAMQFPITDPAAVLFTGKFYGALAAGLPVDQAVSYARKALHAKFRSEWATPVLFMRSPDGNIFRDVQAPPGWVWHEPQVSQTEPDEHDPSLSELSRTDLEVTDIVDAGAEQRPEVTDPYDFLFKREPPGPEPPGPGPDPRMLAAAAAVLVVIALAVTAWFLRDGPAQEALTDSQMLVAGGDSFLELDIYLIDASDPEKKEQLTHDGRSWLPVLSPDRRSMIYVRRETATADAVGRLRTASAIDGTGDRELELPPQCSANVSRPAWIPGTEDLVLRCMEGDVVRLVRVDQDGTLVDVLLTVGSGEASELVGLGDPTVSGDGHTVVFFGRDEDSRLPDGGALYELDLDTSGAFAPAPLLAESEDTFGYSDAVFAQQGEGGEWLAWRAAEAGEATEGPINYEVYAAPFADGSLGTQVPISDPGYGAKQQDPMFSPDGESIVYGAQLPDGVQELFVASLDDPGDRSRVSADDPRFWAVPAWSGR